jgi:CBS domain containing-hemolysin-like protein
VGAIAAGVLGDQWLAVFSGILTFLVIIFSEIIPKTLGERYSERIALIVARPVSTLAWLFTPLVWAIERLTAPITKGKRLPTTNEAEIQLLAKIGQQEGIIESDESEMIQRVFRLNDATAGSLMTPRVNITYLHGDATLDEAKEDILGSQHTRIIVINESIDDVLGIALKDELLAAMIAGKFDQPVADFTREARVVPESVRADKLLEVFRQTRQHLAVVIDEFGGVAGVVTLEDVLEVLTGEIVDETDRVVDLQEEARQRSRKFFSNP